MSLPPAKQSFTNPDTDNAEADKDSWARMLKMFGEVFGKK